MRFEEEEIARLLGEVDRLRAALDACEAERDTARYDRMAETEEVERLREACNLAAARWRASQAERDTAHHLLADVCRCFEAADAVRVLHEAQTSAKYRATMDAVRALWLNASPPPEVAAPDAAGRGKKT